MPTVTLTDAAKLRLDAVSFFLALFLLAAWAVMGSWNTLGRDSAALPRLTYRRALAATGLWGLLFLLVLTMISGARELMTPGAWDRAGRTYRLRGIGEDAAEAPAADAVTAERRRAALAAVYAAWRDGDGGWEVVPPDLLTPPARAPRRYGLVEGRTPADAGTVLAYEPELYAADHGGADPFVLFVGGAVHRLPRAALVTLLGGGE